VEGSPTLRLNSKALALKREGKNILNLAAGEPEFDTPEHIRAAAHRALDEGKTHYTPTAGIPELREAVAGHIAQRTGRNYGAANIVITPGAKFALYGALAAWIEPGDEVLIPAPYWVSYPAMVTMLGGVPVPVWAGPSQDYLIRPDDLEAARTGRTRGLIFNSPNNPTGALYDAAATGAVAGWAAEHDLWIVSDEIYADLRYTEEPYTSIVGADPRADGWQALADGFSKSYAMTGWRLGYLAASLPVAQAVTRLQEQTTSCASSISQYAALAAITGPREEVLRMAGEFRRRRDAVAEKLQELEDVRTSAPAGAFYFLLDVQARLGRKTTDGIEINTAEALCTYLLEKQEIAVVPGEGFGAPGYIRISYAADLDTLLEATRRLKQGLDALT
jgi:aspartate aminotransferase